PRSSVSPRTRRFTSSKPHQERKAGASVVERTRFSSRAIPCSIRKTNRAWRSKAGSSRRRREGGGGAGGRGGGATSKAQKRALARQFLAVRESRQRALGGDFAEFEQLAELNE